MAYEETDFWKILVAFLVWKISEEPKPSLSLVSGRRKYNGLCSVWSGPIVTEANSDAIAFLDIIGKKIEK